jgi:hypothetical protein
LAREMLADARYEDVNDAERLRHDPALGGSASSSLSDLAGDLLVFIPWRVVAAESGAAPETMAAIEKARLLIEEAEALGEPPEDPLLLFSVLYDVFISSVAAFNGDALRDITAHILQLAEKEAATFPQVMGHNFVGYALLHSGEVAEGRAHFDQAIALYDPVVHRPLATRFGEDQHVGLQRVIEGRLQPDPDVVAAIEQLESDGS